ncbi:hypothetical protein [Rhodococcoides yunnanense]|uniref:hypothetical protein n=1 Tax=Rhodococcoides yunnanense TaxID=278209 RepID=UPI0009324EAD|nr:hypothetical protein [Rhodococcus yunnanensis]
MRRFARTTVLASTAAIAATVGAVAFAPLASAEPDTAPAPAPFGSSQPTSPDLVVEIAAVCDPRDGDLGGDVAALRINIENTGSGDARDVTTNFAVLPEAPGVFGEKLIKAGEGVEYTIPSADEVWQSRPGGAAVFSPQLDGNYPDNIAFGLLSVDCSPIDVPEGE